jgi:phospholipase C
MSRDRRETEAERRHRARGKEEAQERFDEADPEQAMRRRDFLARTAMLAGAAGLAGVLPAEALVREAAKEQVRVPYPSPSNMPIDTFVVLMMENRSFDHYFGWYGAADGKNAGLSYPDATGNPVATHRLAPDFQGCSFRDPDHSFDGGRHQFHEGKMDGFVQGNEAGTGSDSLAAGYYLEQDLGFIPSVAQAFTLYDRYFCSVMASTYPNRHYQWGATSGGTKENTTPISADPNKLGWKWETIFDRAQGQGVSVGYYFSDIPFALLYGTRGLQWIKPVAEFYVDAALGQLPNICFVDPAFVGEDDGLSADEHPHGDVRIGQAFMSDITHAFMESPQWNRGAMFINYDEWGGFFEHVLPRRVPDDLNDADLYKDFGLTGFRVPGVAISPYARRGHVSHAAATHESILKMISYRFNLGYLNKRHRYASDIGRSFDFEHPNFERPGLPDPVAVAALPCEIPHSPAGPGGAAAPTRPKEHDLATLETSGYLDRLGFEVTPATPDRIFRNPDSVTTAARKAIGQ